MDKLNPVPKGSFWPVLPHHIYALPYWGLDLSQHSWEEIMHIMETQTEAYTEFVKHFMVGNTEINEINKAMIEEFNRYRVIEARAKQMPPVVLETSSDRMNFAKPMATQLEPPPAMKQPVNLSTNQTTKMSAKEEEERWNFVHRKNYYVKVADLPASKKSRAEE